MTAGELSRFKPTRFKPTRSVSSARSLHDPRPRRYNGRSMKYPWNCLNCNCNIRVIKTWKIFNLQSVGAINFHKYYLAHTSWFTYVCPSESMALQCSVSVDVVVRKHASANDQIYYTVSIWNCQSRLSRPAAETESAIWWSLYENATAKRKVLKQFGNFPACDRCSAVFIDKFFNVSFKAFMRRVNDRGSRNKTAKKQNKIYKKISHQ